MTDTIDAELEELSETFDLLGDWEERYRHIIDLGRTLEPLTEAERIDANKVRGCASQVWLISEKTPDGRMMFRGDSDAMIVQGLVAVTLKLFSNRTPGEILAFDAAKAFDRLGLKGALSTQRANGLSAMVARIRQDAAGA
jgi:cysteine desulfuration protein SufE